MPAPQDRNPRGETLENPVTSLNKESRLFFLGDNSIWSFPSVFLPWRRSEGYFSLAIITSGAFEPIVPNTTVAYENCNLRSLDSSI